MSQLYLQINIESNFCNDFLSLKLISFSEFAFDKNKNFVLRKIEPS